MSEEITSESIAKLLGNEIYLLARKAPSPDVAIDAVVIGFIRFLCMYVPEDEREEEAYYFFETCLAELHEAREQARELRIHQETLNERRADLAREMSGAPKPDTQKKFGVIDGGKK